MAKIKSTLDLVMERTKNLSMTDADKEKLRTKEGADKVRAWIQRYIDGKINAYEMRNNLDAAIEKLPEIRDILKQELVSHIRPGHDNSAIMNALERVFDINPGPVEELIAASQTQLITRKQHHLTQLLSDLKQGGVYGTAVVPNINKSSQWQESVLQAREDLGREIIRFIDTGTSSL